MFNSKDNQTNSEVIPSYLRDISSELVKPKLIMGDKVNLSNITINRSPDIDFSIDDHTNYDKFSNILVDQFKHMISINHTPAYISETEEFFNLTFYAEYADYIASYINTVKGRYLLYIHTDTRSYVFRNVKMWAMVNDVTSITLTVDKVIWSGARDIRFKVNGSDEDAVDALNFIFESNIQFPSTHPRTLVLQNQLNGYNREFYDNTDGDKSIWVLESPIQIHDIPSCDFKHEKLNVDVVRELEKIDSLYATLTKYIARSDGGDITENQYDIKNTKVVIDIDKIIGVDYKFNEISITLRSK